jgi:hypothetical protein
VLCSDGIGGLIAMKKTVEKFTFKRIIWGSFINLLVITTVFASNGKDAVKTNLSLTKSSSIIVQTLTKKLKIDLAQEKVAVKLGNLEQTSVSNNEVKLQGKATCILSVEKTQLPIKFEAKVNLSRESVEDITYTFLESEYAPTSEEEVLMQELMRQISRDYKTREIVISIDNFEASEGAPDKIQYKGFGEVRIGALHWTKINFDVTFAADKSAAKVLYRIK